MLFAPRGSDQVEKLYDEMVAASISPNDFTYFQALPAPHRQTSQRLILTLPVGTAQLLLASKRNERPDRAVLWFDTLLRAGIYPNDKLCGMLQDTLGDGEYARYCQERRTDLEMAWMRGPAKRNHRSNRTGRHAGPGGGREGGKGKGSQYRKGGKGGKGSKGEMGGKGDEGVRFESPHSLQYEADLASYQLSGHHMGHGDAMSGYHVSAAMMQQQQQQQHAMQQPMYLAEDGALVHQ